MNFSQTGQMDQLPTPADVARRYLDILQNTPRVAGDRRTDKLIRRADKAVADWNGAINRLPVGSVGFRMNWFASGPDRLSTPGRSPIMSG